MSEWFYRVTETTYSAGADQWGDPIPGGPTRTNLEAFRVIRHTPKGVWIEHGLGVCFVNLSWRKKFALPTAEEAIESYRARKRRELSIYAARARRINEALAYLDTKGFYTDARRWIK